MDKIYKIQRMKTRELSMLYIPAKIQMLSCLCVYIFIILLLFKKFDIYLPL